MSKLSLSAIILSVLTLSSIIIYLWDIQNLSDRARTLQKEVSVRTRSWWFMSLIFLTALWSGFFGSVLLFFMLSALALREYLTLIETKRADHRALIWAFLILTPLQYYFIGISWYGLSSIFIPVYGFLIITARVAASGDCTRYLERVSKIHWGLMSCVYLLSHAPALLSLEVIGFEESQYKLLFFIVVLTEMSDVFQFIAGKLLGKHKVAPQVSPNKSWEGLLGGVLCTAVLGGALHSLTPSPLWGDVMLGGLICVFGFFGGLCMSAVKRDHQSKDFGTLLPGHGGILDRVDSLCFTSPLFFHFIRYFYTP